MSHWGVNKSEGRENETNIFMYLPVNRCEEGHDGACFGTLSEPACLKTSKSGWQLP